MSIYAVLDGDAEGGPQIATTVGWSDFADWSDDLSEDTYPEILHVVAYGWSQDLGDLQSQLESALKDDAPDDSDTLDIANTLLGIVRDRGNAEVLTVTSGFSPTNQSDSE